MSEDTSSLLISTAFNEIPKGNFYVFQCGNRRSELPPICYQIYCRTDGHKTFHDKRVISVLIFFLKNEFHFHLNIV